MLTRQEIFDKAVAAMLKQGKQSLSKGTCRYTYGDLRCAIGALVSTEVAERWESYNVNGFSIGLDWCDLTSEQREVVEADLYAAGIDWCKEKEFLISLQAAHDMATGEDFCEEFREWAAVVAEQYGLKFD